MANPGKLIQKYFGNFSFPGHEPDHFTGKFIQFYFRNFNFWVIDHFTGKIDDWMSFPVIRSGSCPGNLPIGVKCSLETNIGNIDDWKDKNLFKVYWKKVKCFKSTDYVYNMISSISNECFQAYFYVSILK